MRRATRIALALAALLVARHLGAQGMASLISPGKLSKPHSKLEGLDKCQSCHEPGQQISAVKCLECHKPVAERIKAKKGVHRGAANECASCHIEHAGLDGDLRHFEPKGFDHKGRAEFALDGLHAPLDCKACHKTRSFLGLSASCASCHKDVHNGALGATCQTCHPTNLAFKDTKKAFDHAKTKYPLTGAHAKAACESCHKTKGDYRVARFAACEDCHKNPHLPALGTCTTCHVTTSFKTLAEGRKFDHSKTGYPLRGRHAAVACQTCHVKPTTLVQLKYTRCADCHQDAHKGLFPSEDCAACHTESGFKPAKFDHAARTKFPLDGKHAATPCVACHKNVAAQARVKVPPSQRVVDFRGVKPECASCHADVHKGKLGPACQTCHGAASFRLSAYQHPRQPEFFQGAHAGIACEKCHLPEAASVVGIVKGLAPPASRQYRGVSFQCAACHKDPHLGQVGPDCARCHGLTVKGYKADLFVHSTAKFALTGKHETVPCVRCHARETAKFPAGAGTAVRLTGVSTECKACHKDPHLGQLGPRCETCHDAKSFKVAKFTHPKKKETEDFFVAKHATIACAECHRKETMDFPAGRGTADRYSVPVSCVRCHEDVHRGALGRDCASCHNSVLWRTASRAFHKTAAFTLEGKHLAVPCASCHLKGVLKGTPTGCYDCHWVRKPDDRFKTKLGGDCQTCHRPIAWSAVIWSHASATGFTLETPHKTLDCESCHKGQVFAGTPRDCYSCHRADYERAKNPNHVAGGFPTDCTGCHKPSAPTWQGATFTHATFPLAGVHVTQACAACHKNNVFKGTPRDCFSCHRTDYQNAKSPPHAAAAFPTACETCHKFSAPNWLDAGFNHNVTTTYPLGGVHITQPCTACHVNNVYKGTPRDCWSCHKTDYQSSKNPSHTAAAFATTCESCHKYTDSAWKPATFNHNAATTFALAGAHATQACATCHLNNVFKGTARDCYSCHKTDFQTSRIPSHTAAGFSTTCDTCHRFSDPAWKPSTYSHNNSTTFPLAGAHPTQLCSSCHQNNVFKGTARDCYSCHRTSYQNSASPAHAAAGFPTTCETCHRFSDPAWKPASFNHNAATTFPLAGTHTTQLCNACHKNNVFKGTPRDCWTCHQTEYRASVAPPHAASGFPTTCDTCHRFADPAWKPASFNHSTNTTFPLVGVHATTACAVCHNPPYAPSANNYTTVPTSCYGCHVRDFAGATTPVPHTGFPTACDSCHRNTDATWSQKSSFNHAAYFPLAGAHLTSPCSQCHNPPYAPSPNNYLTVPTSPCSACHMRDYNNATTPLNHIAAAFPTTCDTCHKFSDALWSQGTFTHTTFPLVGVHATTACAVCHNPPYAPSANNYTTVPTSCYGCHVRDFAGATTPVPHTGFPTACDSCHRNTDATWSQKSSFNHSAYFPLVGVHLTTACAVCHNPPYAPSTNNYLTVPTSCYGCHVRDYNGATTPVPHTGFATTCDSCHRNTDATWSQKSSFNHAAYFPLAGAHLTSPCSQCHNPPYAPSPNNYLTVPTSPCSACHMRDYQNATTPVNHIAAGFPTTCDTCHKFSDTTWQQGTFNHTRFPLTGPHNMACNRCHTTANNYTIYNCIGCHTSSQTSPPAHHQGVTGYVWASTACYACHPNGRH